MMTLKAESLEQQKNRLRLEMRQRRSDMLQTERAAASQAISQRLQQISTQWSRHSTIAGYYPLADEVDILPFLKWAENQGHRIALPRIETDRVLSFHQVSGSDWLALQPNPNHLPLTEPSSNLLAIPVAQLDVVLLPGLAFDLEGNRLGYGKGYYDRVLAQLPSTAMTIGVCFPYQVVTKVPSDSRDQAVQSVITDITHP